MPVMDLRFGRWQDVLADVECDALITDPPYSERTHSGTASISKQAGRSDLDYAGLDAETAYLWATEWSRACRGWVVVITDDDLVPAWKRGMRDAGRFVFAQIPIIYPDSVRLVGDGPASAAVYAVVSRPRTLPWSRWGSLPGWYKSLRVKGSPVVGAKALPLMRAIVRDYSRPGDLVCDPCAGGGTTLRAALAEGRRAVGAEMDPETWRKARGVQVEADERGQVDLFAEVVL